MDKMYSEYVAYGGEGPSGFVYCTVVDPTAPCDDAEANMVIPPPQTLIAVEAPQMPHKYEVNFHIPHMLHQNHDEKQEAHDSKSSVVSYPQLACQQTQTSREAETSTKQASTATETETSEETPLMAPYFVQVMHEDSDNLSQENKQLHLPQQAGVKQSTNTKVTKKSRQKVADPKSWTSNIRKTKHQRGEAYVSRRGKLVPERRIKDMKDCRTSCKLHCSQQLSDSDRQHIFKAFYSLSANEKKHFLLNTTERHSVKRAVMLGSNLQPKRKYSFKYFFLVRAVRYNVCKAFYLGTLAISQKPIYNVHMYKSEINLPKPDGRGLAPTSNHAIAEERKERVRAHIASFSAVDSNGSSTSNKKKYLDSSLSVKKMHYMYMEECNRDGVTPLKESMYRKIFNSEFNLHFRKDKIKVERCENCKHPIKRKNSEK